MSFEEAVACFRARWSHPPIDRRDVEERVAVHLVDRDVTPQIVVLACPPACRLFVLHAPRTAETPEVWRSRYVHSVYDVDALLVRLLEGA